MVSVNFPSTISKNIARAPKYLLAIPVVALTALIYGGFVSNPLQPIPVTRQHAEQPISKASDVKEEVEQPTESAVTQEPSSTNGPLVDKSSAGPVKLTYREERSLVTSPSSITTPVMGAYDAPSKFQISSTDGSTFGYINAVNAGGTVFPTTQQMPMPPTGPSYFASWPMLADTRFATPGTYTVNFTAWSPDRQIRYTGTLQLVITPSQAPAN